MDPQLHDHSLKERTCSCSSLGAGILKKELEKKLKCPNISEDDTQRLCFQDSDSIGAFAHNIMANQNQPKHSFNEFVFISEKSSHAMK